MRRLIFITQVVDPDDPNLGAVTAKIRALAERLDEVVVLADRAVGGALPANCRVRTFGSSSRVNRGRLLLTHLARELSPRPLAVVAHSVPLFAILAAPLVRGRRVPLLLWFTHWKTSRTLELAERLSTAVLSVDERSFPHPSSKVAAIGHGIDTERFACATRVQGGPCRIVSLGRTSPAKGFEVIAVAARSAGLELDVYGPAKTEEERGERDRLRALGVRVHDPVPYSEVPTVLARYDVLVNNMREGSLDKIVYEAASTCMPVLASNSGFDDVLSDELRFTRDDPDELAAKLRRLAGMDRTEIGLTLRTRVVAGHSAGRWADRVIEVASR